MTRQPLGSAPPHTSLRPLLWLVLAISAAGTVITSSSDVDVLFRLGLGLVAALCGGALALHHYRHRCVRCGRSGSPPVDRAEGDR
jgi:hypothetical protein